MISQIVQQRGQFDYCIIDEASQLTIPSCLGVILQAKVFILVGDLYQVCKIFTFNNIILAPSIN